MQNEIIIKRPVNEAQEFMAAIQRICEKHGWRHIEQMTEKGHTFHYYIKNQ